MQEENKPRRKSLRRPPEQPPPPEGFERTLAIIKPNLISKSKILISLMKRAGLTVLKRKRTYLKPQQAREFFLRSLDEEVNRYYRIYQEMVAEESGGKRPVPDIRADAVEQTAEKSNIEEYVDFMTSGPVDVLIVAGKGAISKWLNLMGPEDPDVARTKRPETIRARFGGNSVLRNGVYGSDSDVQAEKEIKYFFPELTGSEETKMAASGEYLSKTVNPILLKGLIQLCRQKPDNPLMWLADWLLANNPIDKA